MSRHGVFSFMHKATLLRRLIVLCALMVLAPACISDEQTEPAEPTLAQGERYPGGDTTNFLLFGRNAFIRPADNITPEHDSMFYLGNSLFNQPWVAPGNSTTARDGLGPLFNANSCSACHLRDGRGLPPSSPDEDFLGLLLRVSVPGDTSTGAPMHHIAYGGQLQPFGLPDVTPEATPRLAYEEIPGTYADGTPYSLARPTYAIENIQYGDLGPDLMISPRIAPQIIGLGLLEAIPVERLEALADPEDTDGDGISGRLNHVWDVTAQAHRPGRFGWKAEEPSVRQQVAGAFLGDIGITSPLFPEQNCSQMQSEVCAAQNAATEPEITGKNFESVVLYTSLLAVPARRAPDDPQVFRGRARFNEAGCAGCHTARHQTRPDAGFEEVSDQIIWPYTDLLLHDMGPELADNRPSYEATGREWRTPPLWGLGLVEAVNGDLRLMHDGRARGFAEAILWHGGEAKDARESFRAMSEDERADLIRFLESL